MQGIRKASAAKPSSVLVITPHDGGAATHVDLVACVHCGRHWPLGKALQDHAAGVVKFGFCARCNGICCPGDRCAACVPAEQQLENLEAGRPELHRPIVAGFTHATAPLLTQRKAP